MLMPRYPLTAQAQRPLGHIFLQLKIKSHWRCPARWLPSGSQRSTNHPAHGPWRNGRELGAAIGKSQPGITQTSKNGNRLLASRLATVKSNRTIILARRKPPPVTHAINRDV